MGDGGVVNCPRNLHGVIAEIATRPRRATHTAREVVMRSSESFRLSTIIATALLAIGSAQSAASSVTDAALVIVMDQQEPLANKIATVGVVR